jgi:hypothetical protein
MTVQKQDGLHTDVVESAVDLKGKEGLALTRGADGRGNVSGAGAYVDGIISEGKWAGGHTSINTDGNPILRWIAGAAIARGQRVCSDAQGRCVPGLTNSFGKARKAVAAAGIVAAIIPDRYDADGA